MWVLSGDGKQIINLTHINRVFLNEMDDVVLVGARCKGEDKVLALGKYRDPETARHVLYDLLTSIGDREFFIMPDNNFDRVMSDKIRDSRVKRRGGS